MKPSLRSIEQRNQLVVQNLRLADKVVRGLRNLGPIRQVSHEDAVSMCFLPLLRAAELWDERQGIRFSTYACNAMQKTLLRYAKVKKNGVRFYLLEGKTESDLSCREDHRRLLNQEVVEKILQHVPSRQREILHLCFLQERPLPEVARSLGMPYREARVLYNAAIGKLKRLARRGELSR